MSGLYDLKLLAFCAAFKAKRRNSVWLASDKCYKVARELGVSQSACKGYFEALKRKGLLMQAGAQYRLAGLRKCVETLIPYHAHTKHIRFFREFDKTDFRTYYERIKFALAKVNYKQQQFRADRNAVLDVVTDRLTKEQFKHIRALMRKHKCQSVERLAMSVARIKGIVSGKYHLSRLIGCAPSTAARLLRLWSKKQWISRKVNTDFVEAEVNHGSMSALMQDYSYCYPNKQHTGYFLNRGSEITLKEIASSF